MGVRWRLRLEYDGTDFVGWQVQPTGRTVQGELELAIATFFQQSVRVLVSGRTDAGVHAEDQVVVFDAEAPRTITSVVRGLNALLPEDVAVLEAETVSDDYDPRRWARAKLYRYHWLDRVPRSPLRRRRVWHVRGALDVGAMHEAAQVLVGRHDLTSFRAAGCTAKHAVRVIEAIGVCRRGDEVHLDVRGNGFLRHTVRIVAGSLLEVGLGRRDPEWLGEVLAAKDRVVAGKTAPAHGLVLKRTLYGDGPPGWWADRRR